MLSCNLVSESITQIAALLGSIEQIAFHTIEEEMVFISAVTHESCVVKVIGSSIIGDNDWESNGGVDIDGELDGELLVDRNELELDGLI